MDFFVWKIKTNNKASMVLWTLPTKQADKILQNDKDGKVPIIGNGENFRSMACTINI